MKKDISIEYAHIYTNQHINQEHHKSIELLSTLEKELIDGNKSFSLVVMVDDYSFPDTTFDYASYAEWLSEQGYQPDMVIRESELIPVCDEVVKLIDDDKKQNEVLTYIQVKKYPCSLFIAAWYLLRLGCITDDMFPKDFISQGLINILPESFRPFEEEALSLISKTKYSNKVAEIDYRYFKGRSIG